MLGEPLALRAGRGRWRRRAAGAAGEKGRLNFLSIAGSLPFRGGVQVPTVTIQALEKRYYACLQQALGPQWPHP